MVGDTRQGWALLAAMIVIFVPLAVGASRPSRPAIRARRARRRPARPTCKPGGNMEGKEVRFGIANSALWATATTAASNGSVNAMHDSFTPLGGLVPMWLMQLGEVVFGGVGCGPLRHADVRDRRGVHRRPDGRAHAGVPRQEDRGLRDEDGVARDPDSAARGAGRHRARQRACRARASRASRIPARTVSPRCCTRSRRPATTTAARSRAYRPTRPSTTRRSASRCGCRATG